MKDKILVLGASGLIGRYLFDSLKSNKELIGTCNNNQKEGLIKFDMLSDDFEDIGIKNIKYNIICTGISKVDSCKDEDISQIVNVEKTIEIIKKSYYNDIMPVYISSGAVFEGEKGDYIENDVRNPVTRYGEQRVIVENFIFDNYDDYLIIRPGKVFGTEQNEGLFSEVIERYNKGEEVKCAIDEFLSPIYAGDLARGIKVLLDNKSRGIYHINKLYSKSRYELVKDMFDYFKIDKIVNKCSLDDFNFSEIHPKKVTLNSGKFVDETEFNFRSYGSLFQDLKKLVKN